MEVMMNKDDNNTSSGSQAVQSFTDINTPPIAEAGTPHIDERIQELQRSLNALNEQIEKQKTDVISVIGVFAGLITFLTVEFQFLKTIHSGERVIGFSMLFWALLISFNIVLVFLLDSSQGKWFLKQAKRYWLLMFFVMLNFCGGIFLIVRSNEEIARENKIYEKFSEEFRQELNNVKRELRQLRPEADKTDDNSIAKM